MKKENPNVNLIRALACFLVVLLHCTPEVFESHTDELFRGVLFCLSRPCVPLFFMITGALILPYSAKLEVNRTAWGGVKSFYKKRILKVLYPLLIWGCVYAVLPYFLGVQSFDVTVKELFIVLIKQPDMIGGILWYLYMLIGIYLIIPFFTTGLYEDSTLRRFYLFIWIISSASLGLNIYLPHVFAGNLIHPFNMFVQFTGYFGYVLLGYEMKVLSQDRNILPKIRLSNGIVQFLVFFVLLGLIWFGNKFNFALDLTFLNIFTVLFSGYIFMILYNICISTNAKWYKMAKIFAKNSFGVYLCHMLIFVTLTERLFLYGTTPTIQTVVILLTFVLSVALSWCLSKFEISKYIGI